MSRKQAELQSSGSLHLTFNATISRGVANEEIKRVTSSFFMESYKKNTGVYLALRHVSFIRFETPQEVDP